jgi:hypothetical protein
MYAIIKKKSLNTDGKQFHQYQQNNQSPLTKSHWTQKGNDDERRWKSRSWFGTDTKQKLAGLTCDQLMGYQPSSIV